MSAQDTTADVPPTEQEAAKRDTRSVLQQITQSSALVVLCAIVAAMLIGALLVVLTDQDVQDASAYFFSRPGDMLGAIGASIAGTFTAMMRGALFDYNASGFTDAISPFTDTLTISTPLIFAGLGLGLGFRAGMFNIGAQGQILIGATVGAYVGFAWDLPPVLHLLVAMLGCLLGGAVWGFIPGILKARTGAHEVITTIMLNYIALNLVSFALNTETFRTPGRFDPVAPDVSTDAQYPLLLGSGFNLHLGFLVAIAAAFGTWWLLERSTLGFQFRAVGANPRAARTAGMSVGLVYVLVLTIAGGLAGLGGSSLILGTNTALTLGIAATFGFDAITVALLGRSRPLGIVFAALLFGALRASVPALQVEAQVPVDIVLVIQSLIVLFIAAPPLVRLMFRLPAPAVSKEVAA